MKFEHFDIYSKNFFEEYQLRQYQEKYHNFIGKIKNRSDYLLNGKVIFNDPLDMEAESHPFQLSYLNLVHSPNNDLEWIYMVSRNGYLVDLAITYKLTGNKQYLVRWKELFLEGISWLSEDNHHLWRNLDVGIRLSNWMKCGIYLGDFSKFFSEQEMTDIILSIKKQIHYLKKSFIEKNYLSNWGVLAITGLLNISQFIPTLVKKEDTMWAWKVLEEEMRLQFYQDGIHWEQSPMYHHEVIMSVLQLWINQQYLKTYFPNEIMPYLKKAIEASYYYSDSNNKLLSLNDSDSADFSYIYSIYELCGFLPTSNENKLGYLYVGNKCDFSIKREQEPVFPHIDSGFMAYKNSATYMTLFNGRHGSGHGHASLGSITVTLAKQELIVDPGRHTYREELLTRKKLKSEESHSSLMIDNHPLTVIRDSWGYEKMGNPLSSRIISNESYTQFTANWSGIAEKELVVFKRNITLLHDTSVLIVTNGVESMGEHKLTTSYQISPQLDLILGEEIFLKGSTYKIFTAGQTNFFSKKGIYSDKYNQLESNEILVLENDFKHKMVTCEVFYKADMYNVSSLKCYQNNQEMPATREQFIGIKIEGLKSKESYEYYYAGFDTFKGDKLFHSETGKRLYGENLLFKNN